MRLYHTIVWVPVETPAGRTIPLIILEDGCILYEAWRFLVCHGIRSKSASWKEKAAQYIGLLYDFYKATEPRGLTDETADKFLHNFVSALDAGTIQPDGEDATGLFWPPTSRQKFANCCSVIRTFCKFLDDVYKEQNVLGRTAFAQTIVSAHAREIQKHYSKLFHLTVRRSVLNQRTLVSLTSPFKRSQAKAFPASLLGRLIFEGCLRKRQATEFTHPFANKYNVALMLSLTLLAGGGIRKSELFHLFAEDIRSDEVRLYNPELGRVVWTDGVGRLRSGPRQEYLAEKYGLRPRNMLSKGDVQFCGWKSMLLDYDGPEYAARIYWISRKLKDLFFYLHRIYILHVRPYRLAHPYYLVSLSHGQFGQPWTVAAFNKSFEEALGRIGMEPDAKFGHNPHGLRHLYGSTLRRSGHHAVTIQHAMHHKSPTSQLVYTRPSPSEISDALEGAADFAALSPFSEFGDAEVLNYEWRSDPLKLFAELNMGVT